MFQPLQLPAHRRRFASCRALSGLIHMAAVAALWLAPKPFVTRLPDLPQAPRVALTAPGRLPPPPAPRGRTRHQTLARERFSAPSRDPAKPRVETITASAPPQIKPLPSPSPVVGTKPIVAAEPPRQLTTAVREARPQPKLAVRLAGFQARGPAESGAGYQPAAAAGFAAAFHPSTASTVAVGSLAGFGLASSRTESGSSMSRSTRTGFSRAERAERELGAEASRTVPDSSLVRILWKPRPQYSEEARNLRIEGDVVLLVRFPIDGPVEVLKVVSGLGHGLDEFAARAAEGIRFEPATEDGAPTGHTARILIRFELAY